MFESIFKLAFKHPFIALGSLLPLLPFFVALYRRQYFTKSSKWLFIFLIFFMLSDIPLWITAAYKINNLYYSYTRDSSIFIFLASIYLVGLKSIKDRTYLNIAIFLMVMVLVIQLLKITEIGSILWINRLILGGISLFYFFRLLQNPIIKDILRFPFFWFNSGILFYCLSTVMITFFYKFTIKAGNQPESYMFFTMILEYLSVSMFVIFAIGFWNLKNNKKYIN
ncbi:hypothetical protein EGI22_23785 [Lacihabitans sp. LS3-19]|nr:hypothetical protein [Lacihabitans sp. LS3-19]